MTYQKMCYCEKPFWDLILNNSTLLWLNTLHHRRRENHIKLRASWNTLKGIQQKFSLFYRPFIIESLIEYKYFATKENTEYLQVDMYLVLSNNGRTNFVHEDEVAFLWSANEVMRIWVNSFKKKFNGLHIEYSTCLERCFHFFFFDNTVLIQKTSFVTET